MKAGELRIGNWVQTCFNHKEGWFNAMVIKILSDKIIDTDINDDDKKGEYYFEPIPLTEEWLLKFGFEKKERYVDYPDSNKKIPVWALFSFSLTIWDDGRLFYDWIGGNIQIQYVHQFQNLYFSLTGEELEIK